MSTPIPRFVLIRAAATILGLFLVAAGVFFAIRHFQRQSEALDRLEVQREEAVKASEGGSKNPPGRSGIETRGSTPLPKSGATAPAKKGKDRKVVSDAEKAVAIAKQKEEAYEKIYAELNESGMVRSASLLTLESIGERREILTRLEDANVALDEALKTVRENALAEYRKQGLPEREVLKAVANSSDGAQLEALIAIRACDRELVTYFRQILDLLENDWGAWKPDTADKVLFDKQAEANRYNALRRRIVEASNRQHALQTEAAQKTHALAPSTPRPAMRYDPAFIGPPADGQMTKPE